MSKESIESRVLQVFERSRDAWFTRERVLKQVSMSGIDHAQVKAACERLHRKGMLEFSDCCVEEYRLEKRKVTKKMSKDVPTFGQVLAAIIEHYRSNPDSTPSVVGCHENILPARLQHVDRRQVEDAFAWLLQAGAVTVVKSKYTTDACYAFVPGFQFDEARAAPVPPEPLQKGATPPSRVVALEHAVLDVFSRKDEHDWCSPLHILQQIHGPLRSTLSTVEVGGVCDRLVAQGKLERTDNGGDSYRVIAPAEKVEARSVPDPDHDEEWFNHPAVIELLCNSQAALVEACAEALFPGKDCDDVTASTLPTWIKQLVEAKEQYKKLAEDELVKRHAAEQTLVNELENWRVERTQLCQVRDDEQRKRQARERALEALEDNIKMLGICYNALFGRKES